MQDPATLPPPDVPLDYAPGDPVRRRRRRRGVIVLVLLLAAIALGYWRGPALWQRGWTAYVTRQAARYTAPGDTVIYADEPAGMRPLLANPPPAGTYVSAAAPSPARFAPDPPVLARLARLVTVRGMFQLFAGRGPSPEPLAFLHERQRPGGKRVIVAVRIDHVTYYPSDGGTLACGFSALQLQPNGSLPPTPSSLVRAWGGVRLGSSADPDAPSVLTPDPAAPPTPGPVRVYFGAPDPADASSFTVPYEVNGKRKHWRFRLTADGIDLDEQPVGVRDGN